MSNETDTKDSPEATLARLRSRVKSVQLSTLGEDGEPHSGYTPFLDDSGCLVIFVSQLSLHTRDLLANGKVSAMLIADESDSEQLFARTRVSYQCQAQQVLPSDENYETLLDRFQDEHGKIMQLLRQLPDFVLFRLVPSKGQFVMGFGQAYKLTGENLDQFEHAQSA
ncbi:MAG: HugZ family protein [Granulosicoccus sp.]